MKNNILTIILLLYTSFVFSQNSKEYIVTYDNDTIYGKIEVKNKISRQRHIKFIKENDNTIQKFKPTNIKSYCIINSRNYSYYVSEIIPTLFGDRLRFLESKKLGEYNKYNLYVLNFFIIIPIRSKYVYYKKNEPYENLISVGVYKKSFINLFEGDSVLQNYVTQKTLNFCNIDGFLINYKPTKKDSLGILFSEKSFDFLSQPSDNFDEYLNILFNECKKEKRILETVVDTLYHSNGIVKSKGLLVRQNRAGFNDYIWMPIGTWKYFNEEGKLQTIGTFDINGDEQGDVYYFENEKIKRKYKYIRGVKIEKIFY